MNRIKELIEQVGTDSSGKWMRIDQAELLAELIVKECIDIAFREGDNVDYLAVHFGVK